MPYKIEMRDGKHCVMNTQTGENKGCSDTEDMAKRHMDALYAAEKKALDEKAKSPDDYAYVPDEKSPSTWKLDISDPEHIAGAITALQPGGFRGQKVEIPPGDKGKVISRIRAAINKRVSDDQQKQNLLDRLDKVKSVAAKDMGMMLSQAETNYGAANGQVGKACSVCRWYCPPDDMEEGHCHLVMDMPAPITPNGLCDRWEAIPDMNMEPAPIPVTIVEPMDSEEMALPTDRRGFIDLIKDTLKGLLNPDEPAFSVFKATNGQYYWLARHTGKYVDREGEIIADKAHEEYVARVQAGKVPMPELWTHHIKGTRHGQADLVWKSGGFVLALGHFDDTPEAKHAIAFYQKQRGKIKLSHMFNYPKRAKQGRVFYAYNTIEITTLPDGAEAFPYTSFEEIKSMTLTEKDREWVRDVGGEGMLKQVESADVKAQEETKAHDANGTASKDLGNFEGSTIPADKDIEALKTAQTEIETRLKAVESLPGLFAAVQTALKALTDQVAASQAAENAALEKMNALEKKVLEYEALKAPASKATDTLLGERDKSLLEQLMTQVKAESAPSLVDTMVGGQPAVTTGV